MASPSGSTISLPASNVLLAVPDGPVVAGSSDAKSPLVSLIGGYPTFPALPSASKAPETIRCGVCHQPIPLLAQVYCPPEGGENDRTVYVWACPRPTCQRREGSVRAFRASVRNEEYAQDAEEKRLAAEKAAAEEKARARKNPFSMPDASAPSLFGSGQPLFGAAASNPFSDSTKPPDMSTLSLNTASSSSTTFAAPLPAYQPAQYLSTLDEYLPEPEDDDRSMDGDDETSAEEQQVFRDERWEQLLPGHMDEVFERFCKRLQNADSASNQVLRYELGGVPLPYSSKSPLYQRFFPGAPTKRTADEDEEPEFSAYYKATNVPKCPSCGSKRVFEMQLVPSLISVLRPQSLTTTGSTAPEKSGQVSEEDRRKELARIAKGLKGDSTGDEKADVGEMEWGNIMVFGCEGDCVGYREEYVAVEWEAQLSQPVSKA